MRTTLTSSILLLAAACGGSTAPAPDPGPQPPAPGVVLAIDGLHIMADELDAMVAIYAELDPQQGIDSARRAILDQYLIPLAKGQRDHAEELGTLRARADELSKAAPNHYELVRKGAIMDLAGEQTIRPFGQAPPVVDWVFDPEHLRQTSPPIPLPDGFLVIAAEALTPSLTTTMREAKVYQVQFSVFEDRESQSAWFATVKGDLEGKVEYVSPEIRDAVPRWLTR